MSPTRSPTTLYDTDDTNHPAMPYYTVEIDAFLTTIIVALTLFARVSGQQPRSPPQQFTLPPALLRSSVRCASPSPTSQFGHQPSIEHQIQPPQTPLLVLIFIHTNPTTNSNSPPFSRVISHHQHLTSASALTRRTRLHCRKSLAATNQFDPPSTQTEQQLLPFNHCAQITTHPSSSITKVEFGNQIRVQKPSTPPAEVGIQQGFDGVLGNKRMVELYYSEVLHFDFRIRLWFVTLCG